MANESESGLELVLDNRKLIVVFGLLVVFCGCFFVVGYVEGKRQGRQEANQMVGEPAPATIPDATTGRTEDVASRPVEPAPVTQNPADQQLDWYNDISRREGPNETAPPVSASPSAARKAATTDKKPQAKPKAEPALTYTVQVGAFRQKQELEIRARMLREKGFEVRTEPPETPGAFYLLKVGRFRTRAEAAAMQLRLKKHGFSSFIKTN